MDIYKFTTSSTASKTFRFQSKTSTSIVILHIIKLYGDTFHLQLGVGFQQDYGRSLLEPTPFNYNTTFLGLWWWDLHSFCKQCQLQLQRTTQRFWLCRWDFHSFCQQYQLTAWLPRLTASALVIIFTLSVCNLHIVGLQSSHCRFCNLHTVGSNLHTVNR